MFQYTVTDSFLQQYKKKPKKEKTQTFCSTQSFAFTQFHKGVLEL